eukprot:m.107916 g.107916  ORF g.107916 m.107916 type:complete len:283 (+) comp15324_c0_seq2:3480-4328(+)
MASYTPHPACPQAAACNSLSDAFHRRQFSHPCRYGLACYRKNPVHFQEFSHPVGHPHHVPAPNAPNLVTMAVPISNNPQAAVHANDDKNPSAAPSSQPEAKAKLNGDDGTPAPLVDISANYAKTPPLSAVLGQQSLLLEDVNAGLNITVTASSSDPAVLARKHTSGMYVESVAFDFDDIEIWVEADDDHRPATDDDFNSWALAAKTFYFEAEDKQLHHYTAPDDKTFFTVRELLEAVQEFEQLNRHQMGFCGAIDECHMCFEGLTLLRHADGLPVFGILYGS